MNPNRTNTIRILCLIAAILALPACVKAQVLFSDNFQTDSSANWKIYGISGNAVTNDYNVQFVYDYSLQKYKFNGVTNFVPPAPTSGGTTKGLKVTVNKNGNASTAAVSLYPAGTLFTNDYALKFDLWMDYNGDVPFGGDGSTEFASFGLNHLGTQVNWPNSSQPGDGVWFAVDGDGGSSRDYREFIGDPTGLPNTEATSTTGGFLDRDGDAVGEQNAPDADILSPFQLMFRIPPFQTPGAIGKHWVQVEVRQRAGIITWLVDGYIMAEQSFNNGFTNGTIMLGYMDPFNAEIASPPDENYAIFDNVRVLDLTTNDPLPEISVTTDDNFASEPGADTAQFTVTRTGSLAVPLTVNLYLGGTASNGVDYVNIPSAITFPPGVGSSNITVQVINDAIGETTETVLLAVVGNPGVYEVRNNFGLASIADDGDLPVATVTAARAVAYENSRTGRFSVNFANPNAFDTTVNFTLSGTATNGIAYTNLPLNVTVPAGLTNAVVTIMPINNTIIDGSRTVILTLAAGSGYAIGSVSNATVTIKDDDLPPGTVVFSDDFDSVDAATHWVVNQFAPESQTVFHYDYSGDGIPPAPNSTNTTFGLKFTAISTARCGISASPVGGNFTGDYRLRFDAWVNYNGPLDFGGSQSTECLNAGIGTSGDHPNWDRAGADGVWFAMTGDNGYSDDYEVWIGASEQSVASGAYDGGSRNGSAAYYSVFGGDFAPQLQQDNYAGIQTGFTFPGNSGFAWHDVVIAKQSGLITWTIDSLPVGHVSTASVTLSSNVFVGYMDDTTGAAPIPALSFGLVDNVRVESLSVTTPVITKITLLSTNVQIDFTGGVTDTAGAFLLQSAPAAEGAYTNTAPPATISVLSPGSFRAVAPLTNSIKFFRIKR